MGRLTERHNNGTALITDITTGVHDVIRKLADYEDAEEQGLLLKLPCKVGDMLYSIYNDTIYPVKATKEIHLVNGKLHILCESCRFSDLVSCDDLGKTAFLTKEDAERSLADMGV